MHAASWIATGFSIVTTLSRIKIIACHLVYNYCMTHLCRRIRAIDLPVLSLETDSEIKIILKMKSLAESKMTMVCLTQEVGFVRKVADRIIFLADGTLVADTTPNNFFNNP